MKSFLALIATTVSTACGLAAPSPTLAERLGCQPTDRLLIVNGDDAGMCHAAKPTEELKAITGSWQTRAQEFGTFTHAPEIRQIIADGKIQLIGYRPLRELQRKARKSARGQPRMDGTAMAV